MIKGRSSLQLRAEFPELKKMPALLNNGMIEADAEKQRRGDTVIIVHANSKIIPQLCNTKMPCMWSPSYFVASTGQVSTEVVKRYIDDQRSK